MLLELARIVARFNSASKALGAGAKRFQGDERGVVAVIFAITFCAIFLGVAVAIDFARTADRIPARAERGRLGGARRLASARATR